jgi:hypothetical protein
MMAREVQLFHKTKHGQIYVGDSLDYLKDCRPQSVAKRIQPGHPSPVHRCNSAVVLRRDELRARRARCECERPGSINSGVQGIVAGPPDKVGRRYVERCDACERYYSDEAAGLEYARVMGGGCGYDKHQHVIRTPA